MEVTNMIPVTIFNYTIFLRPMEIVASIALLTMLVVSILGVGITKLRKWRIIHHLNHTEISGSGMAGATIVLRTDPDYHSRHVGIIPKGAILTLYGKPINGYIKTTYKGAIGYIATKYVTYPD